MKTLLPTLKNVGIMSSRLGREDVEKMRRAGLSQGVNTTIAKVSDVHEIPGLYRNLVSEHKSEIIWIPDGDDHMMLDIGLEFLRESTLEDKVGLCVPSNGAGLRGALCTFQEEDGKITVYVNWRIAKIIGVTVPGGKNPLVTYIMQ
jgi:hypothetical protein